MTFEVSPQDPSHVPRPLDADPPASPPGRVARVLRGTVRGLAISLLGGLSILLLAWLTLQWGILPRVQHWQSRIEAWASESAGAPVTIGTVEVSGGLWAPVLHLTDVRVRAASGDAATSPAPLRLGRVDAEIVPQSLLPRALTDWRPSLRHLAVSDVDVDLRRDADGRIHLAGLPHGSAEEGSDLPPALEWLLNQPELALSGGRLRWTDALGLDQPLALEQLTVRLSRQGREHRLSASAVPPAALAGPVVVSGVFTHPRLAALGVGHGGDWRTWAGELTLTVPEADVRAVPRHVAAVRQAGVRIDGGRISLTARLQVDQAHLAGGDADLTLRDLDARLGPTLEPLRLRSLATRLDWALGDERPGEQLDRVRATGLRFETADPLVWPASDIELRLRRDGDAPWRAGEASASRLDLGLLARLARQVPLAGPLRKLIDQTRPAGELLGLRYRWEGPLEAPLRYAYDGEGRALHLQAAPAPVHPTGDQPGRPGIQGAQIRFKGDERSGQAELAVRDGSLDFPGVFAEPVVPIQQLSASLQWKVDRPPNEPTARPGVAVTVSKARFRNADASGELSGSWHTGPRPNNTAAQAASAPLPFGSGAYLPGVLDLRARIESADARRVHRYLPVRLPESARRYVREAVRAGQLQDLQARVQGDLADFPFAHERNGTFQIRTRFSEGELMALPGADGRTSDWPTFTDLSGELVFDRQSLRVLGTSARVGSIQGGRFAIERVDARIEDFESDPVLRLDGQGQGPLADLLQFVRRSPLDGWLGQALHRAEVDGDAGLQLKLQLPIDGRATVAAGERARGQVSLHGNALQMLPDTPRLREVQGSVRFSDAGFDFEGVQGEALGGPVVAKGGLQADGVVRIEAQGRATAAGLRANRELPWLAKLATQLDGSSDYALTLAFPEGEPDLQVSSRLQGLSGLWPAPLAKPAAQAWPLQVVVGPSARPAGVAGPKASAGATALSRQWIRVTLAGNGSQAPVQALYERELGATHEQDRVLRGAIRVGSGEPVLPERGVQAQAELPLLTLDPWLHWFDHAARPWLDSDPPSAAAGGVAAAAAANASTELPEVVPTRIELRAHALAFGQRQLHEVVLDLQHEPSALVLARPTATWRGRIQAQETNGQFSWRQPADGDAQWQVRLARLRVPAAKDVSAASDAKAIANAIDSTGGAPPQRLPDIDLVIDDLIVRGLSLGQLSVQGAHRASRQGPATRDWQLQQFSLITPEAQLTASGHWSPPPEATATRSTTAKDGSSSTSHHTELDFRLQLRDGGQLLQRLGQADVLRNGAGQLSGQLRWDGTPMAPDLARLSGTLKLALDRGRFLRADPGAARLLGVLSLQSLPRRLLFDFSDLTQDGFSFDSLNADVAVNAGVADTRNLRIQGPQAAIISQGRADLVRETQDLHVWVVPDVNAGAASLAYAIVNPAVGLGTLLGQLVLRDSLAEATTREFQITGPWSAPKVDEVPRQRPTPTLPPAAAASSSTPSGGRWPVFSTPPATATPPPAAADAPGGMDSSARP